MARTESSSGTARIRCVAAFVAPLPSASSVQSTSSLDSTGSRSQKGKCHVHRSRNHRCDRVDRGRLQTRAKGLSPSPRVQQLGPPRTALTIRAAFSAASRDEDEMNTMTIGTSTVLVAVGAIMRYAVTAKGNGFDVHKIGGILMIVGIVGAIISIALFAASSRRRVALVPVAAPPPAPVIVDERDVR